MYQILFLISDTMDSPRRNSSQPPIPPPSNQTNGGVVLNNGIENGLKNGYVKKLPIPNVMTSPAIIPYNNERLTEEETTDYSISLSDLPKPPDGGWGWAVVFASFMIHVIGKPCSTVCRNHNFLRFLHEIRDGSNNVLSSMFDCSKPKIGC